MTHLAGALSEAPADGQPVPSLTPGEPGNEMASALNAAMGEVLQAFELLLPLLGLRMLGYPKLCSGYFELLSALLAL